VRPWYKRCVVQWGRVRGGKGRCGEVCGACRVGWAQRAQHHNASVQTIAVGVVEAQAFARENQCPRGQCSLWPMREVAGSSALLLQVLPHRSLWSHGR